mmetsp:Transcript_13013/g.44031  ORF Transcript_13013/g.44031 Transcript_13013/m.44031 type:complete len:222 (-) Transcript_13013:91-756(-)
MPRSKRNRAVSLTKVKPKTRDAKAQLIENVREAVDSYSLVVVLSYENMRSALFKDVRIRFRDARFFLGRNKAMQVALGRTPEEEYRDNLRHVASLLEGSTALCCTNAPLDEVRAYFEAFSAPDFAKAGAVASRSVRLEAGPLEEWPVTMAERLRKLGMNVDIDDGTLVLAEAYDAAVEGQPITVNQAKMLEHLGAKLVEFRITPVAAWSNGSFEQLESLSL